MDSEFGSEEIEKQKKIYKALVDFFKEDMEIKKILMNIAPESADEYSVGSKMDYLEKAYKALKEISFKIKTLSKSFDVDPNIKKSFKNYFNKTTMKFIKLGYLHPNTKLLDIYKTIFTDMKSELLEKNKQTFVGYSRGGFSGILNIINDVESINELLHIIHSSIINNEQLLESMPIIGTKKNSINENITLYGEENKISTEIFKNFPVDLDVGNTDIVSMKDRTLMMIRDRGHALSIDIDSSGKDDIDIRYFIPRILNLDLVKKLPGISTSGITDNGARGFFISKKENISENLFNFISKVPTDADSKVPELIKKGLTPEKIYEPNTSIFTQYDTKDSTSSREFGKITELGNKTNGVKNLKPNTLKQNEEKFDQDK